jgi:hypothetical protein
MIRYTFTFDTVVINIVAQAQLSHVIESLSPCLNSISVS